MNYQEVDKKELNQTIYLLTGDAYLISETVKNIANKFDVQKINISEFNDENFDALTVFNVCNQFSFFNEKRIVLIRQLSKELSANDKKLINDYIKNSNLDCILLIENNSGYFDFLKNVEVIECKASENYVLNYIKSAFAQNGKQIDAESAKILNVYTLGNFSRIKIEIQKICDYLGDESNVNKDIIKLLVSKDTELKVFDLTTALGARDAQKAHKILYDMLRTGESPIKILGLIAGHFRRLFFAKISKESALELSKQLGCKEYAITKAKMQCGLFSAKTLKDILNIILETDYNIKSGVMAQENALYHLVFSIVNSR